MEWYTSQEILISKDNRIRVACANGNCKVDTTLSKEEMFTSELQVGPLQAEQERHTTTIMKLFTDFPEVITNRIDYITIKQTITCSDCSPMKQRPYPHESW